MKAKGFVDYTEALDWLHGLLRFGQRPGLERMQWMLEQLDHPERRLAFVHVAGTNGKGSTCAYLTQMLMEAGYSVGSFTSPYLIEFRERIRYNGQFIPQADLVTLVNELKPLAEQCAATTEYGSPTEFEIITLIAILYFAKIARPAVVIWETGLGGRLDSTNVVLPLVSVITNVGMDHTDVLGTSLEAIAAEKAGIIKPGVPVVIGERQPEAVAVFQAKARSTRSSLYQIGRHFEVEQLEEQWGQQRIRYSSIHRRHEAEYTLAMNGRHQAANAAVALMTIDLLRNFYSFLLEEEEIVRGLQQTRWPGRLEIVSRRPLIVMDGAHNQESMEALAASIKQLLPAGARLHLLFSALKDKPLEKMAAALKPLEPQVTRVHVTTFDFPRAASLEQMKGAFLEGGWDTARIDPVSDWRAFLQTWQDAQHAEDWLVICGSLYFVSQVRAFFPIKAEEVGE
ncbi:bifunctional folylpolyglutamate synthase/dihydrofolate synthase [Brevibacillus sp. H7]|uniref:bifunctional folylpolyglutamate synthase/dihydrofolate synthase n=1 Tax=Brevibacillus sp. H7 TaxID=3349138 RepID=UPI0038267938